MNDWQAQSGATETVLNSSSDAYDSQNGSERGSATDTLFEGSERTDDEREALSPVMILAERALVERDALRGEVARLRDALLKMESNQRMGRSASRELQELREAVELRDREVKRLKDSNVARERLLVDARTKLDEAVHARSAALAKAETRERNAHEAETTREEIKAELTQWRRRSESAELEWHRAVNAERGAAAAIEDLRGQLQEQQKQAALQQLGWDAQQSAWAEQQREFDRTRSYFAAEMARMRVQLAADETDLQTERELREQVLDEVRAQASGREHGMRFAFAELREAIAAKHQEDLGELRVQHQNTTQLWEAAVAMHHGRAEGVRRGAMFRAAEAMDALENEKQQRLAELERHRAELERHRGELEQIRLAEAERHGEEVKHLRESHEFGMSALRGKLQRELDRNKKLESDIAQERSWFELELGNLQAKNAGSVRGLTFAHSEHVEALIVVRDQAAVEVAGWLEKLQSALSQVRKEAASLRVLFEESDATRESLAQQVVQSARGASAARQRAEQLTDEIDQRSRAMAQLVAELTRATVEQHAAAAALQHGRMLPTMADVDAAIVAVSRRVPSEIGDELWSARSNIASAIFAGPSEEIEVA